MGRGYFPYEVNDKEAEKLIQARILIREFNEKIAKCIYEFSDGQYDNACSDGGYLERLSVAIEMLDGCFTKNNYWQAELIFVSLGVENKIWS